MSDRLVREWYRKFEDGRAEVHDEEGRGRLSQMTDELEEVNEAI